MWAAYLCGRPGTGSSAIGKMAWRDWPRKERNDKDERKLSSALQQLIEGLALRKPGYRRQPYTARSSRLRISRTIVYRVTTLYIPSSASSNPPS